MMTANAAMPRTESRNDKRPRSTRACCARGGDAGGAESVVEWRCASVTVGDRRGGRESHPRLTDRARETARSHWLTLAIHSRSDRPDRRRHAWFRERLQEVPD